MPRTARRLGALLAAAALGSCSIRSPEPPPEPAGSAERPAQAPASGARSYSEVREGCYDRNPLREAWFGDLHVHTAFSMDAYVEEVRATPDDAYRFARGESIRLAGVRRARLERPLDFAAVTDHSEWLGEVSLCTTPGSPAHDRVGCRLFRGESPGEGARGTGGLAQRMAGLSGGGGDPRRLLDPAQAQAPSRAAEVCGPGGELCLEAAASVWGESQAAAERWYDRSAECRFTTFHAYEYSATPELSKVHRNVIFRNASVPRRPVSWIDEPTALGLWRALRSGCLEGIEGCDVIAIPHNPNLSNGRIFHMEYGDATLEEQRQHAALRAEIERLVEIMQVKGDSECQNGLYDVLGGPDELCGFEKFRPGPGALEDCRDGTGVGAIIGRGCISRRDFVRTALIEGLREADRLGVNPYPVGIIASTDTHNGTPGDTEERSFDGAHGIQEVSARARLAAEDPIVRSARINPGGLVGIWAEENSRDALFDAMQRRETFGTSGTRIQPRFFAGWDYPAELCRRPEMLARAYAGGVPMGSELPPAPDGSAAPVFAASALRDAGTAEFPGGLLERIQIVKGWVGDDGRFHQEVHDVAGRRRGAAVDRATCEPTGPGASFLCGVWRDPAFDPARRAVYYARVLENPSCRWSALQCLQLPEEERPPACSDPALPRTVQERAWTSPIWYTPASH